MQYNQIQDHSQINNGMKNYLIDIFIMIYLNNYSVDLLH